METTYLNILIEVCVFGGLALLYYLYQKKKIIRYDTYEIIEQLDKFLYDMHHYLDQNQSATFYKNLNHTISELEKNQDLSFIKTSLEKISNKDLDSLLIEQKNYLLRQLDFHCK